MFQIGVHHFVRYVPCAPATESDRPEMAAPISLFQLRELLLQLPGTAALQFFDQVAHAQRGTVFHMHVDMVLGDHALQDRYVLRLAYLDQQGTTAYLGVALQNGIPIFGAPHNVDAEPGNCMSIAPYFCHGTKVGFFRS